MEAISEAINILKKRKKLYYAVIAIIFIVLYIISFSYGYNLYINDKPKALEIIKSISENHFIQITLEAFRQHDYITGFLLILGNNIKSLAILLFSGIIFILPGFISISQATGLGIIMGISEAIRHVSFFHWIFVIVVGLLEFSTIFLACYEGTRLGWILIKRKKKIKKKGSNVFFIKGFLARLSGHKKVGILVFPHAIKNKRGTNRKEDEHNIRDAFSDALKIFVLIIAILVIAAAIETIGIALFGSKGSAI